MTTTHMVQLTEELCWDRATPHKDHVYHSVDAASRATYWWCPGVQAAALRDLNRIAKEAGPVGGLAGVPVYSVEPSACDICLGVRNELVNERRPMRVFLCRRHVIVMADEIKNINQERGHA